MRLYSVLLVIVFTALIWECCARGRGGGRGGSRGGRSRSSSGSKRSSSGSTSKAKITKYTPIKAKSRTTAVISSQTKLGSRSFHNVLFGYITYRYLISNAPLYRQHYPMNSRSVEIPKERAVRIMSTETKMLDHGGKICLGQLDQKTQQKIPEDASKNIIQLNTTIQYGDEKPLQFDGIDQTFTLREKEGVDFKIVSRTEYNTSLVDGKSCVVVEERVNGTVIHMYQTNPDGASAVSINAWLMLVIVFVTVACSKGPY